MLFFCVVTLSSLYRFENVNHVSSITYVPKHAYLSLVFVIGSGSGTTCHVCINKYTLCVCFTVFYFRVSDTAGAIKLLLDCSSTVILSASLGTAVVWKLLKVYLNIIDVCFTPLSLGPQSCYGTYTNTNAHVHSIHISKQGRFFL
jgi:hypothetical protein